MSKYRPKFYTFGGSTIVEHHTKDCIIVDIDGTIANNMHRQHYMDGDNKNWKLFFAEMQKDKVFDEVVFILRAITVASDAVIILCTGRDTDYSKKTIMWLHENEVPFSQLVMRQSGDNRSDVVVKKQMLDEIRSRGFNVKFAIDDRPEVVKMWRDNGVRCLQCDAEIWERQAKSATIKQAEAALQALHWHLTHNTVNREVLFQCIENATRALRNVDMRMRDLIDAAERTLQ